MFHHYHVLSNQDIISILQYALFFGVALGSIFAKLGKRDPLPTYEKGIVGKIAPWVVLLIFIGNLALLGYRLFEYPWDLTAEPSEASIYREIRYFASGYPIWGWANDYQLVIVDNISECILALCWTCYAFAFKRSETNWWKKTFKVIAYIWVSLLILSFFCHEMRDIITYIIFLVPAIILLFFARVKKKTIYTHTHDTNGSDKDNIEKEQENNIADESRFMPSEDAILTSEDILKTDQVEEVQEDVYITPATIKTEQDASTSIIFCKHCGKQIENDSTFCKYCGEEL